MFARFSILGLVAALVAAPTTDPDPGFTLESAGALRQSVSGSEATYSISPDRVKGKRELAIALGATTSNGAIWIFTGADEPVRPGRYPVVYGWATPERSPGRHFHACYMPGTARHPLGMFHSESGWLTITESSPGRIAGTFELRARGFLAANEKDENQWVTVRGSFTATGDRSLAWGR